MEQPLKPFGLVLHFCSALQVRFGMPDAFMDNYLT